MSHGNSHLLLVGPNQTRCLIYRLRLVALVEVEVVVMANLVVVYVGEYFCALFLAFPSCKGAYLIWPGAYGLHLQVRQANSKSVSAEFHLCLARTVSVCAERQTELCPICVRLWTEADRERERERERGRGRKKERGWSTFGLLKLLSS